MKWKLTIPAIMVLCTILSTGAKGEGYTLGVDSLPQDGVPKGTVVKHTWDTSRVYPETTHEYWVYVPAQYDDTKPACVMVFQDGEGYVEPKGAVRVPVVFDNLIHKGEIPVTIGIFVNPGGKDSPYDNREVEYVPLSDTYARFLLEEILPEVGKNYNLIDDREGRAICGMSDGGLCAFTVAWERPDAFSKVISHIGSYTRLRGGSEYPLRIRETRGNPKPIRVFLQDGENDLNSNLGSWTLANINMAAALNFARYDSRFEMGTGGHDLVQGGAIFPDTLRWIWRDYPGVKGADDAPDLDAVVGQWDVVTNTIGRVSHSVLTIAEEDGALTAKLRDEQDGEVEVMTISFDGDILSYERETPQFMLNWSKKPKDEDAKEEWSKEDWSKESWLKEDWSKDKDAKGTGTKDTMVVWVKVTGNTFEGALSREEKADFILDYSVKGRKKGKTPDAD